MAKTRTDLIARALGLLNVVETGQDVAAEDASLVDGYIDGKLAELSRRQILYVQDANAIDDEFFLPLAKIVANAVGPEFGQAYSADTDAREEQRLRDINRRPSVNATMRTEFI